MTMRHMWLDQSYLFYPQECGVDLLLIEIRIYDITNYQNIHIL